MTRKEALQTIEDVIRTEGLTPDTAANIIITRLDECLHFDTEVIEVSSELKRVPTFSLM